MAIGSELLDFLTKIVTHLDKLMDNPISADHLSMFLCSIVTSSLLSFLKTGMERVVSSTYLTSPVRDETG